LKQFGYIPSFTHRLKIRVGYGAEIDLDVLINFVLYHHDLLPCYLKGYHLNLKLFPSFMQIWGWTARVCILWFIL